MEVTYNSPAKSEPSADWLATAVIKGGLSVPLRQITALHEGLSVAAPSQEEASELCVQRGRMQRGSRTLPVAWGLVWDPPLITHASG